jgi:hypothetical protein
MLGQLNFGSVPTFPISEYPSCKPEYVPKNTLVIYRLPKEGHASHGLAKRHSPTRPRISELLHIKCLSESLLNTTAAQTIHERNAFPTSLHTDLFLLFAPILIFLSV